MKIAKAKKERYKQPLQNKPSKTTDGELRQIEQDEQIHFPEELRHFFISGQDKAGIEKLVIKLSSTLHLTVHLGMQSKVCDLHLTDETKPVEHKHKPIFEIPHSEGEILLNHCLLAMSLGFEKYWLSKRINIGKFYHHNCYFIRQDNEKVLSDLIKESKKKVQFEKGIPKSQIMELLILPKDFEFHPTKRWFDVYRFRKGKSRLQGFIWYAPGVKGRKPYFVSRKSFNHFTQLIVAEFFRKSSELNVFMEVDFKSMVMQKANSKYLVN